MELEKKCVCEKEFAILISFKNVVSEFENKNFIKILSYACPIQDITVSQQMV